MSLFSRIFTWWNGATLLTRMSLGGAREVGRDEAGNIFYLRKDGRRWVIYNGEADAARVSPEWHIWLHGADMPPPSERPLPRPRWVKPYEPNATGTPRAHMPSGALQKSGIRARGTGDYEPWTPDA